MMMILEALLRFLTYIVNAKAVDWIDECMTERIGLKFGAEIDYSMEHIGRVVAAE